MNFDVSILTLRVLQECFCVQNWHLYHTLKTCPKPPKRKIDMSCAQDIARLQD